MLRPKADSARNFLRLVRTEPAEKAWSKVDDGERPRRRTLRMKEMRLTLDEVLSAVTELSGCWDLNDMIGDAEIRLECKAGEEPVIIIDYEPRFARTEE